MIYSNQSPIDHDIKSNFNEKLKPQSFERELNK